MLRSDTPGSAAQLAVTTAPDRTSVAASGTRRAPAPETATLGDRLTRWRERVRALALAYSHAMPEHAFFSHATAAILLGLPTPGRCMDADGEVLHVAVPAGKRLIRAAGVHGHEIRGRSVAVVHRDGLRVASPVATWGMLGSTLTVGELVALGDAVVAHPRASDPRTRMPDAAHGTIAALESEMARGRRIGIGRLRDALPRIRVGSASPAETDLRLACEDAGLPEAELDIDLVDGRGVWFGYTELGWRRWRVLVEYEGDHHRTDRDQWHRDVAKHARCRQLGWEVVRVTAAMLYPTPRHAVAVIRDALRRAGWEAT